MKARHSSSPMSGSRLGISCPGSTAASSATSSSYSSDRQKARSGCFRSVARMLCKRSSLGIRNSLHLVVGASDGRERPGRTPPLTEPRGRGGFFRRVARYLDNSLLGDALGAVALFALLFVALWLPEVLR